MGSSASCCCCRPRRSSRIGTDTESRIDPTNSHLQNLPALIPGMGKYLDSSSLIYGNHLKIASPKKSVKPSRQISVDEDGFHFHHLIDTGGFGFVFKATRKTTGKTYALKVQPMEFMARLRGNEISLQMEKTALVACRDHPFIVSIEYSFHTKEPLYAILAMEYVSGGTLSRLVAHSPQGRLPSELAKIYTAEMALALNFMHQKGIIYRDLKPSNVLIAMDGHIKVTDFGLAASMLINKKQAYVNPQENSIGIDDDDSCGNEVARSISSNGDSDGESVSSEEPEWTDDEVTDDINVDFRRVRRRTLCGTAGYRPPEQVGERYVDYASRNGYDERVDFFSLGVTVFFMVCGHRPFPTMKQMLSQHDDLMKSGISSPSRRRSSITDTQSNALQRSATRKIKKDIEFRCLMSEVKFPDFIECPQVKSFIEQLLAKDPNDRPRFNGIKSHTWFAGMNFDAAKIKEMKIPVDWVLNHALHESTPKPMRRNSMASLHKMKTDLSLGLFIEDMVGQIKLELGDDAEAAAARWMAVPSLKTKEMFLRWNYISEDALRLEMDGGSARAQMNSFVSSSRRYTRRATQ